MVHILSIYPNCSKGGMATVYRSRALANSQEHHDFLFMNDRGGHEAFESIPNGTYRVYPRGRFEPAIKYITDNYEYDEIRITSLPELASELGQKFPDKVVYEFHTSTLTIIDDEIGRLDVDSMRAIQTPSQWLTKAVTRRVDPEQAEKCVTTPNLVDSNMFHKDVTPDDAMIGDGAVPLLWIGRFDKGKNFNDFLRVVSSLPAHYVPIAVVSYENQPDRMSRALLEARAYGLGDRLRTYLNLSQEHLASLYTWARDRGGVLVSTSLAESFGYSVAEALACGLPAVAYRVGGVPEVPTCGTPERLIAVGDTDAMAQAIREVSDDTIRTR